MAHANTWTFGSAQWGDDSFWADGNTAIDDFAVVPWLADARPATGTDPVPPSAVHPVDVDGIESPIQTDFVVTNATAGDTTDLSQVLRLIDVSGADSQINTGYTITLGADITLTADPTAINLASGASLTIEAGAGNTLDGGGLHRGLFVFQGDVTIEHLVIQNARATGGAGGSGGLGGGGGAGLGGGLFVAGPNTVNGTLVTSGGTATLVDTSFRDDGAIGGAGGGSSYSSGAFGSGGGMGGAGQSDGGGGGLGGNANGGPDAGAGIVSGAPGGGGPLGAGPAGGGGGHYNSSASYQGGGGVGGTLGEIGGYFVGAGGFGGGGGYGGRGGFGGGGGTMNNSLHSGSNGGFGGGGSGGEKFGPGLGGFGAGDGGFGAEPGAGGTHIAPGGGGLGAGGDIFVQQGGILRLQSGTLAAGTSIGGSAGTGPAQLGPQFGDAMGATMFLQGDLHVTLDPAAGQTISINGQVSDMIGSGGTGTFADSGALVLTGGGTALLEAANNYTGATTIDGGSTLVVGVTGAVGSDGILFAGGSDAGTLRIAPGATLGTGNFLTGLAAGDTIDLEGLTFVSGASAFASSGTLFAVSGGTTVALRTSGVSAGPYPVNMDGGTGTEIIACYVAGTCIATPAGARPIECLAAGDAVCTFDGQSRTVRWIGRRDYAAAFVAANPQLRPVRIRAGAIGPGLPERDLLVSPSHAVLVAGVEAGALVNGTSVLRERAGVVRYRHLEFDAHELIVAEGLPAESFVDSDTRGIFQNAHDFAPRGRRATRRALAQDGPELSSVWHGIAARAGITSGWSNGILRGHVEWVLPGDVMEGWVTDPTDPTVPVELEAIGANGACMRSLAMRYRIDLDRAGIADGRCGFRLAVGAAPCSVRRVGGGEALPFAA